MQSPTAPPWARVLLSASRSDAPITAPQIHGTSVGFHADSGWLGALMIGKPGAGKSELALELIALGAKLVADDQTCLRREGDAVELSCPIAIRDMIELRGLGIFRVPSISTARLTVIIDMDALETQRFPEPMTIEVHGLRLRYLRNCASRAFATGLKHYILSRCWE